MRTKNPIKTKIKSLKKELLSFNINKLSKKLGFEKRQNKKINGTQLIHGFFNCAFNNTFSLNNWASEIGSLSGKPVSKQGVANRINDSFIALLENMVCQILSRKTVNTKQKLFKRFINVFLQDSTCIALPDSLVNDYKGNYSNGSIKAVAKLQVIFNLVQGRFSSLTLTPYNKNDQSASWDILASIKKGDLIIRDMGYFVLKVLNQIIEQKADFISHIRSDVNVYDSVTGKELCLSKLIGKKKFLKKAILLGKKDKVPVTLVAIKTKPDIAKRRQYKILKDRDKRRKVTVEKLHLAGWDIFVTSISDLQANDIKDLYKLRWQIEIIFKSWKSHIQIEKNISSNMKKPQLFRAIIYLSLLMIVLIIVPLYKTLSYKYEISLLKLTQMIVTILPKCNWKISPEIMNLLAFHSLYEKRNRLNMAQKFQLLT